MSKSVLFETTPTSVTEEIRVFCESIAPSQEPVYVPVRPVPGAKERHCHPNVERHARQKGGTQVFGWTIWQSQILFDAEFHCNWMSADGDLIDITPKADKEKRILFLPDPNTVWTGTPVPNRRQARNDDPKVVRCVSAYGQLERIMAKYLNGGMTGDFELLRMNQLQMEIARLVKAISDSLETKGQSYKSASQDRRAKQKLARQRRKRNRRG